MTVWLYRALTSLAGIILWPYGRLRAASGSELWLGRMARSDLPSSCDLWLHASSVGEVGVIANLVHYLLAHQPETKIHVTTMTPAGQETAEAMLGDSVSRSYFPLDTGRTMRRTLKRLAPQLIAIAETEIWPNLVTEATALSIPVVLVNGRMSARSHRQYRRFQFALRDLFARYERFFFKSHDDARRYESLGVCPERWEVAGDMKFDAPLPDRSPERIKQLRDKLGVGDDDFVLVAGSTRDGEERILFDVFQSLRRQHSRLRLVLAPRHVERANSIMEMAQRSGLATGVYDKAQAEVTIVDRVGLLNDLYLAANLAFVGGTLVDIGGHNLLEPVWAGTSVLFGPSIHNVTDAAKYITEHDFGAMVDTADDLVQQIEEILSGKRTFATKNDSDLSGSATATVGDFILERLHHA